MMESGKSLARVGVALVVVSAAIAAALVGGAGTGRAAPGVTVDLVPLIATSSDVVNQIPQVTYGGKIGYHLTITNAGTSTTPQTSSVVVTSPNATFVDFVATFNDAPLTTCGAQSGSSGHVMVCSLPTGTLTPGDTFEADLRFQATTSTTVPQIVTTAALSVAAQTVGGKKNNGNTLTSDQVATDLVAAGATEDTYLRATEPAATGGFSSGHKQRFGLTLPDDLLGAPFGVAVSIHDEDGAICVGCLTSHTVLTIPAAASLATALGNPFYRAAPDPVDDQINPYRWEMHALAPSAVKPTKVYYLPDNATGPAEALPQCADLVGGGPTRDDPLCLDGDVTQTNAPGFSGLKSNNVFGHGIENGNITFG